MSYFQHLYNVGNLDILSAPGLSDIHVVRQGAQTLLYATSVEAGLVLAWNVSGAVPVYISSQILGVPDGLSAPVELSGATTGGNSLLWVHGIAGGGATGYSVGADGTLSQSYQFGPVTGSVTSLNLVDDGTQVLAVTTTRQSDSIDIWQQDAAGAFTLWQSERLSAGASPFDEISLAQTKIDGQAYILAVSARDNSIISFQLDAQAGLSEVSHFSSADGLGLSQPSHIEVVQMGQEQFALVGAFGSSSITVLRIRGDGRLQPVDQVNDTLSTRFAGVSVMQVIEVGGRVFVIAGGTDDGLTLMTLLPTGQLLQLDTIAASLLTGLQNPGGLSLTQENGHIRVFVVEDGPGILSSWDIDVSDGQTLVADSSGGQLTGTAGRDILISGTGTDRLDGGAGADVFVLGPDGGAHDSILGFELGIDRMDLSGFDQLFTLSQLSFQSLPNGIRVRFGNEVFDIFSADGLPLTADQFGQGDFFDLWHVDVTQALSQTPVAGSLGNDILHGTAAGDTLMGMSGNDTLIGHENNDLLNGGAGADQLIGGAGIDTADYTGSFGSLRVDLMFSQINTNIAAGDSYDSIENLIGSRGFDNLRGTFGDNLIQGMANVDYIFGRRGNDTLEGGIGDDVLFGGVGQDVLIGGIHRDRAQYSESLTAVVLDLMNPGLNTGEAAGDSYNSIEDLAGGKFADHISGDMGANRLFGREGADTLIGRGGNDSLNGGAHSDRLEGGLGNDNLRGGQNADTFVFDNGADLIEDFNFAHGDRIEIDGTMIAAVTGLTGQQIVNTFASVVGGQVVFDFGAGDTLTIQSLADTAGLAADIFVI